VKKLKSYSVLFTNIFHRFRLSKKLRLQLCLVSSFSLLLLGCLLFLYIFPALLLQSVCVCTTKIFKLRGKTIVKSANCALG